jgi:kinesin family member 18/19
MADLFQRIEDRKDEWNVEVMVTFLEIYNEEIRDLLAEPGSHSSRGGLSIREDKTVKVVGLVELRPRTAEEVKEIVLQGNSRRTQSPTHANETSSRSHAVLQVHITQSPRTANVTEQRTMATLSIIDLAGSERAAATSNMGQRMVEGANINKSLLALGNCINALCESGGAVRHVPYRNSKLTRLLKFSLGGNCKTVMIVCVAPTSNHFDDTHNTLLYAERATKIKTKVVTRNVVNVDRHVGRYVEAINRLNNEVAELKGKLAGKANAEAEIIRRKKAEANAEVERAKNDMKVKLEQTQASIAEGASCSGQLSVAHAKLRAIRARLAQINSYASGSLAPLSADLEAERALLQALAGPEEQAVRAESALNVRLQRSNNSGNMLEATIRAVTERKSDKLDETTVENVKLAGQVRTAEVERIRAETERDAIKEAVEAQAQMIVALVGIVGRCTVMIGEASRVLGSNEDRGDPAPATVRAVANSLKCVAERNDEAFGELVGHTIAAYATHDRGHSALDAFTGFSMALKKPNGVPAVLQSQVAGVKPSTSRRSSSHNTSMHATGGSPGRRSARSPRKSLRSSLASQPYRRASSDKHQTKEKEKKSVQWRDEAGKGTLDDGGPKPVLSITPAETVPSSTSNLRVSTPIGSESEWEDEKPEDNLSASFTAPTRRESASSRPAVGRRPRASRLEPLFLKIKGAQLDSLAEDDESASPVRRLVPLADRSLNHLPTPEDSSGNSSSDGTSLHNSKRKPRQPSPARRAPSIPHAVGTSKNSRRRSNIGPLRTEKARRRSSLIPQLSPLVAEHRQSAGSGARRVPAANEAEVSMRVSPAKRVKRSSVLTLPKSVPGRSKAGAVSSAAPMVMLPNVSISAGSSSDANVSADISARSSSKRTWR